MEQIWHEDVFWLTTDMEQIWHEDIFWLTTDMEQIWHAKAGTLTLILTSSFFFSFALVTVRNTSVKQGSDI